MRVINLKVIYKITSPPKKKETKTQILILCRDRRNKAFSPSSRTEEGQAAHLPPDRLALHQFYWCESRYCTSTTGHKFLQQTFFSASTLFLPLTGYSFDLQLHLPDHIFIKLALTSDNWHHLALKLSLMNKQSPLYSDFHTHRFWWKH